MVAPVIALSFGVIDMMFCERCNKRIPAMEWQLYDKYCQNCHQLFRANLKVKEVRQQLSPELIIIWTWPDTKSIIPNCEVYMYDVLVSNLYMSPEGTTLESVEYILNYTPVHQRIIDYWTRESIMRK